MQRRHRSLHARIWMVLVVVLPAIVLTSLLIRKRLPLDAPAIQLSPPVPGAGKIGG